MVLDFLNEQVKATPVSTTIMSKSEQSREHPRKHKASVHSVQLTPSRDRSENCSICSGERHPLYQCTTFTALNVDQRQNHVRTHHLCFNCLLFGRRTRDCRNLGCYKRCSKMHHTCLHHDGAILTPADSAPLNPADASASLAPTRHSQGLHPNSRTLF